ncbi:hypothetical protein [Streptomyces sp. NPDC001070]
MTTDRTIRCRGSLGARPGGTSATTAITHEIVTDELAHLVYGIARSTGTAPETVLASMSDELLNGLFLLRAQHLRDALRGTPAAPAHRAPGQQRRQRRPLGRPGGQ